MVSEERKEFAKMRRKMLCRTGSKQFICARCGLASKSVNIHHIEELHQGGENKNFCMDSNANHINFIYQQTDIVGILLTLIFSRLNNIALFRLSG